MRGEGIERGVGWYRDSREQQRERGRGVSRVEMVVVLGGVCGDLAAPCERHEQLAGRG